MSKREKARSERRTAAELPRLESFRDFARTREDFRREADRLRAAREAFQNASGSWQASRRREESGGRPDFAAERRHSTAREELAAAEAAAGAAQAALDGSTALALPQVRGVYMAEQEKILQEALNLWERLHELQEENEALRRDYRQATAALPALLRREAGGLPGEPAPLLLPDLQSYRKRLIEEGFKSFDTKENEASRERREKEAREHRELAELNYNRREYALAADRGERLTDRRRS
jgi:hypothetical protein